MIRHAPSIGLGLGLSLRSQGVGAAIDSDVLAFAAESGATDLSGLNNLVKYLKAESLYSNFVIYPMKSAQNAGSGATVYSLGGLTTNDMALSNAPTWGVGGIDFDGVNQSGAISDFIDASTLTVFTRVEQLAESPIASESVVSQYDFGNNNRSWELAINGSLVNDPYEIRRSSDGTSTNLEIYSGGISATIDRCIVANWVAGGARSLWVDKSSQSLALIVGSAQTSRFNAAVDVMWASELSSGAPANFFGSKSIAGAFLVGTNPTTAQRETITDFINAL